MMSSPSRSMSSAQRGTLRQRDIVCEFNLTTVIFLLVFVRNVSQSRR